jgi:hypothetical protein
MLGGLNPKESRFKVNLIGGRKVEITLRPFTLGDKAWMESTFNTEDAALGIANMNVDPWARIIWHQMTPESRDIFMRIKFEPRVDETTNEPIDIMPEGHERFLEALFSVDDILSGIKAFSECQGQNDFQDDGVKKKTA